MADREKAFWTRITEGLWHPKRLFQRIEVGFADGIPDGYYVVGEGGWMELKCPSEKGKRTGTALFSGEHQLSIAQRNWLLAHRQAGGVGWIAIETETRMMLVGAKHADEINAMTGAQLWEAATFKATRPLEKSDWDRLAAILSEPMVACHGVP